MGPESTEGGAAASGPAAHSDIAEARLIAWLQGLLLGEGDLGSPGRFDIATEGVD